MLYVNSVVRDHRLRLGLTQARLSQLSGVSTAFIQSLEAGSGNPSLKTISSLCRVLGLTLKLDLTEPDWSLLASLGAPLLEAKPSNQAMVPSKELLIESVRRACQFFSVEENRETYKREFESIQALLISIKDHYYLSAYQELEDSTAVSELMASVKITERIIKLRRIALEKISKFL